MDTDVKQAEAMIPIPSHDEGMEEALIASLQEAANKAVLEAKEHAARLDMEQWHRLFCQLMKEAKIPAGGSINPPSAVPSNRQGGGRCWPGWGRRG